ncbi:MAG: tRNA 2-selenouridine(34) synthase MnmH, partial [Burkholderiales bacterium PBB5]
QLPDALVGQLHCQGRVLRVTMADDARVQLLLEDYGFFAQDVARFCQLLDGLVVLRGREVVQRWQAQAQAGDWAGVFAAMMAEHYDPLYNRSIDRHFAGFAQAAELPLADGQPDTLRAAARAVLAG